MSGLTLAQHMGGAKPFLLTPHTTLQLAKNDIKTRVGQELPSTRPPRVGPGTGPLFRSYVLTKLLQDSGDWLDSHPVLLSHIFIFQRCLFVASLSDRNISRISWTKSSRIYYGQLVLNKQLVDWSRGVERSFTNSIDRIQKVLTNFWEMKNSWDITS